MRKIILLFALFLSLVSVAQDSHLGLSMGPAFPLGDFASSGDYLHNGYAKPGFNLAFDANYIPTWYFGIGGTLNFATSGVDKENALEDYLEFLDDIELPVDVPEDTEIAFGLGNWNYINLLVGPTFALPGDIFQFNVKALFGLSVIMPPSGTIEILYDNTHYMTSSNKQALSFGYQLGADLIYKMRGNYSIKVGADYFGAKAKYDVVTDLGEAQSSEDVVTAEKNFKVNAVHLTIGLSFLF